MDLSQITVPVLPTAVPNAHATSSTLAHFPKTRDVTQPVYEPKRHGTNLNINMDLPGDKVFLESHVNAYFGSFSTIPQYAFLHKATFLRAFHHDTVDPLFLRCVCGISSRFLQPQSDNTYVSSWLQDVEAQIFPRLGDMKVQNLQLLLLLICWYSLERKISNMWTASAMAARIAYGIRLNYEAPGNVPFLSKEVRRRLMWSIFMLDKYYAGGFGELTLCNAETMHVNLPCEERNFELDIPVTTFPLNTSPSQTCKSVSDIGIMGHMSRLVQIRHEVLAYVPEMHSKYHLTSNRVTKQIITNKANPYDSRSEIQALSTKLQMFIASLPAHLQNTLPNLLSRAYTSDICGYVGLHTLWHQCHCDLYRFMIPGIRESIPEYILRTVPTSYADECRRLCLHYANEMCKLWTETMREADMSRITDQAMGIYAYQCANILINLWDLDSQGCKPSDCELRRSLAGIVGLLERLAGIYPIVAEIKSEIKSLIDNLDIVTTFYTSHSHTLYQQSLTATWRASLRQHGTQEGQTTSRFSLLESLHNQNKSEESHTEDTDTVNIAADTHLPGAGTTVETTYCLDVSQPPPSEELVTDDFWSTTLNLDFDCYDTRVDPFCRVFEDWALADDS
ncbi:hypothetical protein N7532_001201 [Penicillium argentinense]|uniref:Xylanolytic transcriptional activator regulatory domain-containing protein n=1 Tax=Penicillium argentinense TaxID=1131581 RepID=A0A9W9G209_9EURO|nr:uncharacterized protein N7532_001201 [Penicillium argentinense]KAJ5110666.1 hypothetical protein N7532_001201 [Penicillium argentinense]